ncbi:glycosyltransferase family 2 protein [Patescibacteria group bacterium]|nr:glycosyltransferase family 2 protein [Patescibacteria group bacterium]MBP7841620.1 glycosyltransferase family 2 protein [Patescibacteria group bacterium]
MAVKTAACREVGGYSINAIVEDMDMAFKLNEHGRRVEQSHIGVRSHVPDTFLVWIKQKMRRNSGGFQCFSKHWRVWIKNPIHVLFTFLVNGLFLTMSYGLYKQLLSFEVVRQLFVNLIDIMTLRKSIVLIVGMYAQSILAAFSTKIGYTIFSLPYVFPYMKRRSTLRKVLLVIPFSWIYVPIFSILGVFGMLRGVYRTYELRDGRRAW